MSAAPVLALVAPDGALEVSPAARLLGLPSVRRTALAAKRAGFERVVVVAPTDAILAALDGTPAERAEAVPPGATTLPWNHVVGVRELTALRRGDASATGVPLVRAADRPRAERLLLRGLIKDTEGFMSRYFDRKISLAVSRRVASTPITPDQMTIFATAIGLAAAPFFLSDHPSVQWIGGALFLLHSIIDGCDGELARLKFQESRRGGLLDFWGDNLVHVFVFAGMGLGLARTVGAPWPLWCAASAIAFTAASAWFIYNRTMRETSKAGPLYSSVALGPQTLASKIADALSRRDFIYLVLILSLFGKADWFIALSAVAVPAYFLVLVGIALSERRTVERHP
ncbi:MAG TPA: CDP-alcohol phosphatidyltransferase family protein [Thermoanaerobaculia bacterium]|nr:CDP-alcohol phosphatidyltransferase family protein [Thermoanaerobaculia bacterium]